MESLLGRLSPGARVLEIGCGPGLDAAGLVAAGMQVVAFDRSPRAVALARANAPGARILRTDVRAPLPFPDGAFEAALSSLSLHYFPWTQTLRAFGEIRRAVQPGAPFLFRVNATDDVLHGAGTGVEVEPGLFLVESAPSGPPGDPLKRFFDEQMVRAALGSGWSIERLEHMTIDRYQQPKRVWECLAIRHDP